MPLYGASILSSAQRCNNPGPSRLHAPPLKEALACPASFSPCVCVCVRVCGVVRESRLSCGFIRNCYRRACCIRSELCCTQSSIFISAARGWYYWARADPLALQPIRPVHPAPFRCRAYCFACGSISRLSPLLLLLLLPA